VEKGFAGKLLFTSETNEEIKKKNPPSKKEKWFDSTLTD